jgi:ATP-dependent RNA helicase SUPV3L1/SUV3
VVEAWLDKVKAEAAEHRAQRLALIEELKAWAAATPPRLRRLEGLQPGILHQFRRPLARRRPPEREGLCRIATPLEGRLQGRSGPLEAAQKLSLERRHAMIEEAKVLGAAPMLRIDAVKALQQRWQAEAQSVPLDRKHEQKAVGCLPQADRRRLQPQDEEREKAAAALSERDRAVLDASKALEAANATGDAQKIRAGHGRAGRRAERAG